MDKQGFAHNVFFTLKDTSDTAVKTLIEDCYAYLKDNSGILYFSAGRIASELNRDVNVTDFHVGLHVTFSDKSYHDQHQVSEKHSIFADRNKVNWAQVRVFDFYIKIK